MLFAHAVLGRAADPAGPLLDPDGDVAHATTACGSTATPPWASRRRRWPRSSRKAGLRDGGLRRRVRARRPLGAQPGLRALRRPLRPQEVQAPRPRHRAEAGQRGHGRGPRLAGGPQAGSVLRLDPPLRRPHPLRASRAVPLAVRAPGASPASTTARSRSPTRRWDGCVSWLRTNGIDKKTVVVIIGDHGEGLGSHGEGTHGYFVYDYTTARAVPRRHAVRRAPRGPGRLPGELGRRVPHRPRRSAASRRGPKVQGRSLAPRPCSDPRKPGRDATPTPSR